MRHERYHQPKAVPCECGSTEAYWHGPETGLREYCCDACWARQQKLCVSCGEPIPPKRLEILPGTTTCVACSSVTKKSIQDMPGRAVVQHTGGLHEKYLHEEDLED
jgi:hypothetical protein